MELIPLIILVGVIGFVVWLCGDYISPPYQKLIFGLTVLFVVTTPFDKQRKACHRFVNDWVHTYLKIWPGWRVRIKGTEHIPSGVPSVLVAIGLYWKIVDAPGSHCG